MNATEAFRTASVGLLPADDLTDRIVVVGLGPIGTRVLAQLCTTDHKVVAVERDPHARGVALARELDVPLVLEDAGAPGVLDRARIRHSKSLLVLTRDDSENLDIVLAARETTPSVRVVMRLYDDDFAAIVQRTLRASYPQAPTRSRSVSALAAPSFAAAMMGRHVLGDAGRAPLAAVHRGGRGRASRARRTLDPPGVPGARVAGPGRRFGPGPAHAVLDGHPHRHPVTQTRLRLAPVARAGAGCGRSRRAGDDTAWPGHPHDRGCSRIRRAGGGEVCRFRRHRCRGHPRGAAGSTSSKKAEHCESATPVPTSPRVSCRTG
ncbi:NAD(P)-binding protein [Streptomyces sp. NPDC058107]|uniref:NAD(P)-binding protein n=1 Tax=Streptomyces sp. NPDC058107 TaxID=3346343 RepID=UPI0036E975D1